MRRAAAIFLTVIFLGLDARADDLSDAMVRQLDHYLAGHPIIKKAESPKDVALVWLDMAAVGKMIFLAQEKNLPARMKTQITKRLDAAMGSTIKIGGWEDEDAAVLAETVRMFANQSLAYGKGQMTYPAYYYGKSYLTSGPIVAIAHRIEAKYARPGTLLPENPGAATWVWNH